jgi:hypothetical protein
MILFTDSTGVPLAAAVEAQNKTFVEGNYISHLLYAILVLSRSKTYVSMASSIAKRQLYVRLLNFCCCNRGSQKASVIRAHPTEGR